MKTGLVIGKFLPLHRGHQLVIETALAAMEHVVVLVCDNPAYPIAAELRVSWVAELYPHCSVLPVVDIGKNDDSPAWAEYTLQYLEAHGLSRPTAVFTSESYGEPYAACMNCRHVSVDPQRLQFPVSGTAIRNDPRTHWDYIPLPVREHFALRVCVLGAESTGTTTLASELAKHYETTWTPEYGRSYSEGKLYSANGWHSEEFAHIARMQETSAGQLARECNKLLILDTDAFATELWHERYLKKAPPSSLCTRYANLYILTSPDIPFVQDGLRDGEHIREWMHGRFDEELQRRGLNYVAVDGPRERRMKVATQAIDDLLAGT